MHRHPGASAGSGCVRAGAGVSAGVEHAAAVPTSARWDAAGPTAGTSCPPAEVHHFQRAARLRRFADAAGVLLPVLPSAPVLGTERVLLLLPSTSLKGVTSTSQCACLPGAGALSYSAVQLLVMEKLVQTLIEFEAEATRFASTLIPKEGSATLITLSGELGAGKTAFVKAVARALGVEEVVTSPTFVLEKIYLLPEQSFKRLIHVDAYRLEKGSDLAPLGFDEIMRDAGNLVMLEWPEQVSDALPKATVQISIKVESGGSRTISYA